MSSNLVCLNEERRHLIREANLNGLDYVEVDDTQLRLKVYFLGKAPDDLAKMNSEDLVRHVVIEGGRRIRNIQVTAVEVRHQSKYPARDDCMIVTVNTPGDFSTYTLKLVEDCTDSLGRRSHRPYPGFDPRYSQLEFSFKAGCSTDLDCQPAKICEPEPRTEPEISYLAKDYATFRQLMLDRLALTVPEWKERHEADVGITLVELLAYAGDYLSYQQDAVATEAYLGTARQRISVRRHAQLVDYQLHEGCNARAFVFVGVNDKPNQGQQNAGDEQITIDSDEFYFITGFPNARSSVTVLTQDDLRSVPSGDYLVYEPVMETTDRDRTGPHDDSRPVTFYQAHNEIPVYTWGDAECCLPVGTTSASLTDEWTGPAPAATTQQTTNLPYPPCEPGDEDLPQCETPDQRPRKLNLNPGDFLLFEEITGPQTGSPHDADPLHRHVVRITNVRKTVDELCEQPVLEIEWAEEDALPFSLCVSTIGPAPDCKPLSNVCVARGNIVLVDHGRMIAYEPLGNVGVVEEEITCEGPNRPGDVSTVPARFAPVLRQGPLTFSQPLLRGLSAAETLEQDPRKALPDVWLNSTPATASGQPLFSQEDVDEPEKMVIRLRLCDEYEMRCLLGLITIELRDRIGGQSKDDPVAAQDCRQLAHELRQISLDWSARHTLLDSNQEDPHFVVEIDNRGQARLRFGDGELGQQPVAGSQFRARYRTGSGPGGNVGADRIRYMVLRRQSVSGITLTPRNPLPAAGGTAPESIEEARQFAPNAFRRQLRRAITPDDYAAILARDFEHAIQRAKGTLRWTGSGNEVLVAVDLFDQFRTPKGEQQLINRFEQHLFDYRRIGHDVSVKVAEHIPLKIKMTVCVLPDYLPGDVKGALLNVFSNRNNRDGTRGYFHPDNLSFGDGIALSRLVAAAQAVIGVENVIVQQLERLFEGPKNEIADGLLPLGPLEIARCDNDPNFRENGTIEFELRGGR